MGPCARPPVELDGIGGMADGLLGLSLPEESETVERETYSSLRQTLEILKPVYFEMARIAKTFGSTSVG